MAAHALRPACSSLKKRRYLPTPVHPVVNIVRWTGIFIIYFFIYTRFVKKYLKGRAKRFQPFKSILDQDQ